MRSGNWLAMAELMSFLLQINSTEELLQRNCMYHFFMYHSPLMGNWTLIDCTKERIAGQFLLTSK
jgi:hypothetical protein